VNFERFMGPSLSGIGTAEAKLLYFQAALLFWDDVRRSGTHYLDGGPLRGSGTRRGMSMSERIIGIGPGYLGARHSDDSDCQDSQHQGGPPGADAIDFPLPNVSQGNCGPSSL
jgi:hypothetical protein